MIIHHLYHSGFVVFCDSATLIFDWWRSDLPAIPQDKPCFVFVSHIHHDHYDERIWNLAHTGTTHYILDQDVYDDCNGRSGAIALSPSSEIHWDDLDAPPITGGACDTTPLLRVNAFESNDEGLAYLIRINDNGQEKSLFFSGDLNSWQWDRDPQLNDASDEFFRNQVARIPHIMDAGRQGAECKESTPIVDVAFLPLDTRLIDPSAGIVAFQETVGARTIVPMHYADDRQKAESCAQAPELAPWASRIDFSDCIELP